MTSNKGVRSFLSVSDIHLNHTATTITPTQSGFTDTDQKLWTYTKSKIRELLKAKDSLKIDFIVFTGDLPSHGGSQQARGENIGVVLSFLSSIADSVQLPLLFVPGNNDALAGDYKSFRDNKDQPPFVKDINHVSEWPFIGNKGDCGTTGTGICYIDSSQLYGYYSAYPLANKSLRYIGLNTVMNNNNHSSNLCYNPPADGKNQAKAAQIQMDWFVHQMQDAASNSEKILIAMHIPPGMDGYSGDSTWANFPTSTGMSIQNAFIESVTQFKPNVIGILTGHTHMDEIRIISDKNGKFSALGISTPGITPQHSNNPGFKLFSYDSTTYELYNFQTFWSDFISTQQVNPFTGVYSFNDIYGNPPNNAMEDHIESLYNQGLKDSIRHGMQNTYRVGQWHHLSTKEDSSMYVRYDPNAIIVTTSQCPSN